MHPVVDILNTNRPVFLEGGFFIQHRGIRRKLHPHIAHNGKRRRPEYHKQVVSGALRAEYAEILVMTVAYSHCVKFHAAPPAEV